MNANPLCAYLYEKINEEVGNFEGNYLEIGAFNGAGAASVARNLPNKTIYIIDPFIEDGNTSWISGINPYEKMENIKAEYLHNTDGLNNIQHFENTTEEVLNKLTDKEISDMNISMVLIDGDHHAEFVTIDYEFAMKLIGDKPGFIIFDDMHNQEVVVAYTNFLNKYKDRVVKTKLLANDGAGMYIEISKE